LKFFKCKNLRIKKILKPGFKLVPKKFEVDNFYFCRQAGFDGWADG
jgi:hypothetical protein